MQPPITFGYVWKESGAWHYVVLVTRTRWHPPRCGVDVILYDNSGDYEKIQNSCRFGVAAVRRLLVADHLFEPYRGRHQLPPILA